MAVVEQSNNDAKTAQYLLQQGMQASYLEGAHWELFRDQQLSGKGISAAHIIAKAASLGTRVFLVNALNVDTALFQLNIAAEVKQEIADAVAAGRSVTVPQQDLQLDTWSGLGYVITDETTGAAAYKITGGFSGGGFGCSCIGFDPTLEGAVALLLGVAAALALLLSAPVLALWLGIAAIGISVVSLLGTLCQINEGSACNKDALEYAVYFLAGIGILFALGGPVLLGLYLALVAIFASAILTSSVVQRISCPPFPA